MNLPFFLARRFVAGETLDSALPVVDDSARRDCTWALDLLGEDVKERAVAERCRDAYIDLVEALAARRSEGDTRHSTKLSIKLSMIGQMIDEQFCLGNLLRLLDAARVHDVFVRLDMEGSATTDSTLSIFEQAYEEYPDHVGPVLQAMLKRTERDIKRMCELNASVRLCKGAYKEPPAIAYQDMDTIRERYLAYAKRLLTEARYPGIATHDDQLIGPVKTFIQEQGIGREAFEFQMLYGLRPATQEALAREGYRMLVYVPYGTEWLSYFYRRLRERKENVWFVLKNLFRR